MKLIYNVVDLVFDKFSGKRFLFCKLENTMVYFRKAGHACGMGNEGIF